MESNKESDKLVFLGQSLAQRGLLVLRFDFAAAAPAGNFEEITYSGEVADLQSACSFMGTHQRGKSGLLGSSMGGTVTLLFAARQQDIATIVTLAAPVHPERFIDRLLTPAEVRHWRETGYTFYHGRRLNASLLEDLQEIDVPEAARRITCPVLILHGDRDEVVPVEEAHELHGYLSGPKKLSILEGGDHRLSDTATMKRALTEAIDWLCAGLD
jgi:pimeloyl-ACP methyl ester carboxylesterase